MRQLYELYTDGKIINIMFGDDIELPEPDTNRTYEIIPYDANIESNRNLECTMDLTMTARRTRIRKHKQMRNSEHFNSVMNNLQIDTKLIPIESRRRETVWITTNHGLFKSYGKRFRNEDDDLCRLCRLEPDWRASTLGMPSNS